MCYVCHVCREIVPPKVPQLKFAVKRPNGQIERELKVCPNCHFGLTSGLSMIRLISQFRDNPRVGETLYPSPLPDKKETHKTYVKNGRSVVVFGRKIRVSGQPGKQK